MEKGRSSDPASMGNALQGLVSPEAIKDLKVSGPAAPAADPKTIVAPPVVVKSPLGDQVYGGVPITEVKLTSFEDVKNFAKDFAGIEIKDVQDFVSIFGKYKELDTQAAKAATLEKTVDTYKSTLDNLPKDVSLVVSAAINGEDHGKVLKSLYQKQLMNFDKAFDEQDELSMINHYTGKGYTKETLDKLDPAAQEALLDSARVRYKADQEEYKNMEKNTKSAIEERQNKFRASVESSISNLLLSNPRMDKASVDRIRQTMTGDLSTTLFAKDKTYLPDAAEKIAYMLYGKETIAEQARTIGDFVKKIQNQTESKTTERILMRSDQPPLKGSGAPGEKNVLQAEVERATSFLKARG